MVDEATSKAIKAETERFVAEAKNLANQRAGLENERREVENSRIAPPPTSCADRTPLAASGTGWNRLLRRRGI